MDEQSESKWVDVSEGTGESGENSHGDPADLGRDLREEPRADAGADQPRPAPRPVPAELLQRVADTANMVDLLMRELWTQAELEAESLRDSARRQAEALIAEAQRAARGTLEQARERAQIMVGAAKLEAANMAADAERLSREFLGRLSTLVTPSDAATVDPAASESSGLPD